MKNIWTSYLNISLMWKIAVGFLLGVGAGFLLGPSIEVIKPLGDLFLRLLKFLIIPMLLFTLITGLNHTTPKQLGRMGGKVFFYYIVTSAFALVIGLFITSLFNPGVGLSIPTDAKVDVPNTPSFVEILIGIVPTNIVTAFTEMNLLQIIFIAVTFGLGIGALRDSNQEDHKKWGEMLHNLALGGTEITFRIMRWVLEYAPVGIFALTAVTVGTQGSKTLTALLSFVAIVYLGIIVQFLIYYVLLYGFGVSPKQFFNKTKEATLTAFVTRSSLGTLPVTLRSAEKLGLKKGLYGFSLPLGATMNMDGAAIRVGASVIFAANVVDVNLSWGQMIAIVLTGTLASVGTAGVPGAGLITLSTVLVQAGLPIEIVALIASVDALLGMAATSLNVTGDLVGSTIVNQTEEKKLTA